MGLFSKTRESGPNPEELIQKAKEERGVETSSEVLAAQESRAKGRVRAEKLATILNKNKKEGQVDLTADEIMRSDELYRRHIEEHGAPEKINDTRADVSDYAKERERILNSELFISDAVDKKGVNSKQLQGTIKDKEINIKVVGEEGKEVYSGELEGKLITPKQAQEVLATYQEIAARRKNRLSKLQSRDVVNEVKISMQEHILTEEDLAKSKKTVNNLIKEIADSPIKTPVDEILE